MPTATSGNDRLELLLLSLGQRLVEHLQADGQSNAECDGGGDSHPHRPQRGAVSLLAQEGADDPDDQRRLDSLSQPDHKRWQQRSPLFDPTEGALT